MQTISIVFSNFPSCSDQECDGYLYGLQHNWGPGSGYISVANYLGRKITVGYSSSCEMESVTNVQRRALCTLYCLLCWVDSCGFLLACYNNVFVYCSISCFHIIIRYGFYGDVITESEKYRWMGPKRYDYAGTKVFLKHRCSSSHYRCPK